MSSPTPLLEVPAVELQQGRKPASKTPVSVPKKLAARPLMLPDREVAPHLLSAMWKASRQNQLFKSRRVILPSGRICDDWNVTVRGLTDSYRTARENSNANTEKGQGNEESNARWVRIAARDKEDLTALALVWSRSMLHGAELNPVRLVFPPLKHKEPEATAEREATAETEPIAESHPMHPDRVAARERILQRRVARANDVHLDPEDTIQAKFEEFHRAHPEVYGKVVEMAWTLKQQRDAGRCKWVSIGAIWERLRSDWLFAGRDSEGYKLNNNYRSRYARLLIADFPEFAEIIETRELQSK
jgi:hypothetical protein